MSLRWLLVAAAVLLAACDEVDVTREPDPPLSSFEWAAVWLAIALAVAAGTGLLIARPGQPRPRPLRLVASAVTGAAAVAAMGGVPFSAAMTWRAGTAECEPRRLLELPQTIVQIECGGTWGGDEGWWVVGVFLLAPLTVIFFTTSALLRHGLRTPTQDGEGGAGG